MELISDYLHFRSVVDYFWAICIKHLGIHSITLLLVMEWISNYSILYLKFDYFWAIPFQLLGVFVPSLNNNNY